jgi:ABC-type lipoprotein release transport system permease subunit
VSELPVNVYFNLLGAAAANVARYKTRSAVVVACLVAICGPYVTGVAISEGIRADAEISVRGGADLYLTLDQFGRNGPVPLKYLNAFRRSPNVTAVVPRIVGRAVAVVESLGSQQADTSLVVILGLEPEQMKSAPWYEKDGRLDGPRGGEVMIGSALADHLKIASGQQITFKVGDVTMPFRVSAVFPRDATIWSAQLVCMTLEDAGKLFNLPGYASDFLIYCRPGPGNVQAVRQDTFSILGDIPYRLQTKNAEVASYLDKGFRQQQGVFTVLFLVAFAVGIPALLIASGLGLSDRNREIGVCKAVGWQTTDVMLMVTFEQVFLSVIAACLAVLVSYLWVRPFNGVMVAQFFISELGNVAPFPVPARFTPAAPALALLLCLTITMVGGLYTTWRIATRLPAESIR